VVRRANNGEEGRGVDLHLNRELVCISGGGWGEWVGEGGRKGTGDRLWGFWEGKLGVDGRMLSSLQGCCWV
jgi:hypothetical protein